MWPLEPPRTTKRIQKLGRPRAVGAACTHGPRCSFVGRIRRSLRPPRLGEQKTPPSRSGLSHRLGASSAPGRAVRERKDGGSATQRTKVRIPPEHRGPRASTAPKARSVNAKIGLSVATHLTEGAMNAHARGCIVFKRCRPRFDSLRSRPSPNPSARRRRSSSAEARRRG